MMELNEYEIQSLAEIGDWEKQKHEGFHKKILDVASKPVDYLIKRIGAGKFEKLENAIQGTIKNLLYASTYTVDPQVLIKRAHEHGVMIEDISDLKRCDLAVLDKCNRKHIDSHEKAAAIQGAVLGLGGALLMVADLTAVLVQDFHMIQEIAFCYGYDPNDIVEKEIILRIIVAGIGGSEVKFRALEEIEALRGNQDRGDEVQPGKEGASVLGAKALEQSLETLTVALLVRLVPRALPLVSMAVSAHSNHEIMKHCGNTGFMVYRKRFLERKQGMAG